MENLYPFSNKAWEGPAQPPWPRTPSLPSLKRMIWKIAFWWRSFWDHFYSHFTIFSFFLNAPQHSVWRWSFVFLPNSILVLWILILIWVFSHLFNITSESPPFLRSMHLLIYYIRKNVFIDFSTQKRKEMHSLICDCKRLCIGVKSIPERYICTQRF